MSPLSTKDSSNAQTILARMSRDSARKVLRITVVSVGVRIRFPHREKKDEVGVNSLREVGVETYFEPMQFREPVENGRKASF